MKAKSTIAFLIGATFGMVTGVVITSYLNQKKLSKENEEEEQEEDDDGFFDNEENDLMDEEIAKDYDQENEKEKDSSHVTMGEALWQFLMK